MLYFAVLIKKMICDIFNLIIFQEKREIFQVLIIQTTIPTTPCVHGL